MDGLKRSIGASDDRETSWTEKPIEQRPGLSNEVYERLVDDLISLKIPPGERLSVDGLARRFGVSQTPTRGALIRLEAEGLVVKRHYAGYFVAPVPSLERMKEIFQMRSLIEPAAAAQTAAEASTADIAKVRMVVEDMQQLLAANSRRNSTALVMLDSQFHTTIAAACGNTILFETLTKLFTQLHIFRVRIHAGVVSDVVAEHVAILEAIAGRSANGARTSMSSHIDAAYERLEPYVRRAF